ncbi:transposase [Desulfatiglans anilini]|uniref:transposase n=1 Tax=Desulfatiglans anilini TaxID=90728 RepID=UPI000488F6FB|nr:transposase [Desulfatiglans anilini]
MKKDSVLVKKFLRSGKREAIVSLKPSPVATKFRQEKNLSANPLRVRVLRFTLKNREKVVLLTSLLDKRQFPLAELKELYTKRWSVETAYSHFKCRIEIEKVSGKSPLAVLQDFQARVLTANLAAMIGHPVQDLIEEQAKNHPERLRYEVNFTYALSSMKSNVVLLFARRHTTKILRSLLSLLGKSLSIIRPGLKNPRKRGPKLKIAAMAYKPIA